ncbi:site-specific DNA-methyltransferase [Methyloglobulus sp.]|uniref:site-specific DNA-methyltransferase n=1 Tax=Methyloglobulus sp. TaxID=2518622 RepID=UPI0032B7F63F
MPLLDWLNKNEAVRAVQKVPYRLLEAVPELSAGDANTENMLIQGDNLEALKALLPLYAGKVKCIYIDPPYNTRSAFEHYDDNLEHSVWLSLMYPRLELLRELLAEDGSIFVSIDDNESHYLMVMLDEVFSRANFINKVSVKMKQTSGASGGGEDKRLKKNIEYVLIYTKNKNQFGKFNDVYAEEDLFDLIYEMRDSGKSWKYTRVLIDFGDKEYFCATKDGTGEEIRIYSHKNVVIKTIKELMDEDNLTEEACYIKYFKKIFRDTNAQSSIRTRVMEATEGAGDFFSIEYVPKSGRSKGQLTTLYYKGNNRDLLAWLSDISVKKGNSIVKMEKIGTYWDGFPLNNLTKEGDVRFPNGKKPEALIQRIIELSTQENDLVLDSFLGSGTTAAVAHKMNRRYIGIEMGDHAQTHCQPRLKKVVEGEQGGISKAVNWQGGGGFHYFRLGETIFDAHGAIHHNVRFASLAAHIWFCEIRVPLATPADSPLLGIHDDTAYYLLYNGILGDRRPQGGNVLTQAVLDRLPPYNGRKIIYGEASRFGKARLEAENIMFKQIPYDVRAV